MDAKKQSQYHRSLTETSSGSPDEVEKPQGTLTEDSSWSIITRKPGLAHSRTAKKISAVESRGG